ncbi:DDE-type integrase/transposase/recombinase [Deinococcus sp. QL22]|uniref:DDE-type integrase/transposase/recombinase n=1 Tax=Deinococcus sp. QL22 TaxID=2939437 RepID=UPI0035300739
MQVCPSVDGVRRWWCRAMDDQGFVLDLLLQRHRDGGAAQTFLTRRWEDSDVSEVIHTDGRRSDGAAIQELTRLNPRRPPKSSPRHAATRNLDSSDENALRKC